MDFKDTKMYEEILSQPIVIKNCREFNKDMIVKVAKAIKEKGISSIFIAARGTSSHAGTYFKYLCESLTGIPCGFIYPSTVTVYDGNLNFKNSLVIGVSQSGAAEDVLAVLECAKKTGAITVGVTNNLDSKIAKAVEYHLFCNAGEEKSVAATKTFTSQMFVLAQLAGEMSKNKSFIEDLNKVEDDMNNVFGVVSDIVAASGKFKDLKDCFVLARGMNYAMALEAALKIQETCYVKAKGYAISDFHHGPFAMVDENSHVILIAPNDKTKKDSDEMLLKLQSVNAKITVISDNDSDSFKGCYAKVILPFKTKEFTSVFPIAVIAQLLACSLSVLKGINPDNPRGLKKVTITK